MVAEIAAGQWVEMVFDGPSVPINVAAVAGTPCLLGAESPDLIEMVELADIEILFHPSLSNSSPEWSLYRIDKNTGKNP